MQPVTHMMTEQMAKEIEDRARRENVTQDEIVRRAIAEHLAKKPVEATSEYIPRDIKTRLVSHRDSPG